AGWITRYSVLGVLLPDLPASAPRAAIERVRLRIERALGRHAELGGAVTIAGRLFPEPMPTGIESAALGSEQLTDATGVLVDPLLPPELREARGPRRRAEVIKRGLDIVGSVACLVALAPVMLLIAAFVRLTSPGPILFRQLRVGYQGRPFTMLKFRS